MKKTITSFHLYLHLRFCFAQKDSSNNLNGLFKKANSLFGKKSSPLLIYQTMILFQV